ncbi:hypothetical protein [Pseudoduganella namucuonensis]|uniref:DUF2092 domain-containing protein n=1 Tax=Pseudoduganella namucuonensis TaxID=1035707 RepID=A0A1I7IM01_9BURK|nr:hypothetical protein [Pseudoduganella namucuonensis]SFU73928.1 hypothetical protein SAMN05216552_1008134 [Pseudoduganella namucuonensis]
MPSHARPLLAALILLAAAGAAPAQDAPIPTVNVPYTRDPVDKSYRKMLRGMDRYQRDIALAPRSTLRFQVLPRLPTVKLDGVTLQVKGDSVTLPVAMAQDHSFTLERNPQAVREDAALVANRKTSSMTWRAMVRSAGVPEGMRRLGDLRLECLVGMESGLVSNNSRLFSWLSDLLADADQVCADRDGNYLQFSDRPLFGVTLRHGGRAETLPFRALYAGGTQTPDTLPYCDCQVLLDRTYYAPIWDRGWPDDTLIGFEYMDDPAEGAPPVAGKDEARARLGPPAMAVRFDSGHEVWMYEHPPARRVPPLPDGRPQKAEQVLLFGPGGEALKARRREP